MNYTGFVFVAITAVIVWAVSIINSLETQPRDTRFDGSHLVKICSDGTYIFWYPNLHEYRTGGTFALVIDPEKVCESRK